MEYYQNMLCVTYADLEQIAEREAIKKLTSQQRCHVLRRGYGRDTYALIQWSSLPVKYQNKFVRLVGDPLQIMKQREAEKLKEQRHDPDAVVWFNEFTYMLNGQKRHLTPALRDKYIMNATALKLLLAEHQKRVMMSKASNNTRGDLWDILLRSSEELRKVYAHTLPVDKMRFRERVLQYKEEGMSSVVSGKLGNRNTVKITGMSLEYILSLRRCKVPFYSVEDIFHKYNEKALAEGWKTLESVRALELILNSDAIKPKWFDAVYGEQAAKQKFERKHSTELPTLANAIWYGDGTKLNLYYRDDDGKVRTTMVYEVMDAASEVLLGYHISDSEDYDAQYRAYRMAVERAGVKPMEVVYDNQGGHKKLESQNFFSKLALRHRPTAPYNGSSKTIENAFYRFQRDVLKKYWFFTGQNITAKMESSRPDIEFIEANRHNLPTLPELKDLYATLREEWNNLAHPKMDGSRLEVYNSHPHPKCPAVTEYDIIEMFWLTTTRPATFTANGLRVTIHGREHLYEVYESAGVPDYRWATEHIDAKFLVQYDPMDMHSVRLLNPDDKRPVAIAETKMVIHRAAAEQTEEERRFIRESREALQRLRAERIAEARELEIKHGVAPEQHGLVSPRPKNLPKELQEQFDRRLARARGKKMTQEGLGTYTKNISLTDWMAAQEDSQDDDLAARIRSKY